MKHKHGPGQSSRGEAVNSCHPEQLLFEEMRVILATMKRVHKESARIRQQTRAINCELASLLRGRRDASLASILTDNHRTDVPAADKPADGHGQTIVASNRPSVPRLPEAGDLGVASRAGPMQILGTVNQSLCDAGFDVVDIMDAAMEFALERLLQTVGRKDAVRYLRYVTEQIERSQH